MCHQSRFHESLLVIFTSGELVFVFACGDWSLAKNTCHDHKEVQHSTGMYPPVPENHKTSNVCITTCWGPRTERTASRNADSWCNEVSWACRELVCSLHLIGPKFGCLKRLDDSGRSDGEP
jgi:hypothetical protein